MRDASRVLSLLVSRFRQALLDGSFWLALIPRRGTFWDSHIISSHQDFSCRRLRALPFHSLCETFAWSGFVRSAGMTFPARTSVNFQLNWSTLCFQRQTSQALVTPAMKALLRDMASLLVGEHFKALLLWAVTEGLTCNFVLGVFSIGPVRLRPTLRSRGVGLPSSSITGGQSNTSTCWSQTMG